MKEGEEKEKLGEEKKKDFFCACFLWRTGGTFSFSWEEKEPYSPHLPFSLPFSPCDIMLFGYLCLPCGRSRIHDISHDWAGILCAFLHTCHKCLCHLCLSLSSLYLWWVTHATFSLISSCMEATCLQHDYSRMQFSCLCFSELPSTTLMGSQTGWGRKIQALFLVPLSKPTFSSFNSLPPSCCYAQHLPMPAPCPCSSYIVPQWSDTHKTTWRRHACMSSPPSALAFPKRGCAAATGFLSLHYS